MGWLIAKCMLLTIAVAAQTDCVATNTAGGSNNPVQVTTSSQGSSPKNLNGDKVMVEETDKTPKLDAEISVQAGALEVKYRIKNPTGGAIFIVNAIWDYDKTGNVVAAPLPAYVTLDPQGLLHVAKQVAPLPRTKKVESRIIPFVTRIEAGGEYTEIFKLPIPVEEYNPYFPKESTSETEDLLSGSAKFTLQFVRESGDLTTHPSGLGPSLAVSHPDLFGVIETLSSNPRAIEVSVKKRTGAFESF